MVITQCGERYMYILYIYRVLVNHFLCPGSYNDLTHYVHVYTWNQYNTKCMYVYIHVHVYKELAFVNNLMTMGT